MPASAGFLRAAGAEPARGWEDGAKALAAIRNDLECTACAGGWLGPAAYADAWTLAVWFVEMAVLAVYGYRGRHWNRNTRARGVGSRAAALCGESG